MNQKNISSEYHFKRPAIYQIKIQGDLGENWSDKLGGMQVTVERRNKKKPVSILIGKVRDQSALAGILNALYELNMFIITIDVLEDGKS